MLNAAADLDLLRLFQSRSAAMSGFKGDTAIRRITGAGQQGFLALMCADNVVGRRPAETGPVVTPSHSPCLMDERSTLLMRLTPCIGHCVVIASD
ncbi:hypothetical protein PZ897_14170 [Hoeflea sp. YIM 152468]|uniref:hypothetical protein n=1 Tax=Hoeflea sp. YIM 152468 TaxID=3031759 RepID=UPI0023DC0C54|nr:hypothetical protein [Hoeflea sp. YIM 152468]MDF1609329.1 hypothetical protein [Hoeflea sp. YIM 152468]